MQMFTLVLSSHSLTSLFSKFLAIPCNKYVSRMIEIFIKYASYCEVFFHFFEVIGWVDLICQDLKKRKSIKSQTPSSINILLGKVSVEKEVTAHLKRSTKTKRHLEAMFLPQYPLYRITHRRVFFLKLLVSCCMFVTFCERPNWANFRSVYLIFSNEKFGLEEAKGNWVNPDTHSIVVIM